MKNPLPRWLGQAAQLARDAGWDRAATALDAWAPTPPPPAAPPRAAQWLSGSHAGEAGTRVYRLYLPSGAPGRQPPLVVMLHGCHQDPDDFAAGTDMNRHAEARGCAVLYPGQSRLAHLTHCWNWFRPRHQARTGGECALLADMAQAVVQKHGLDPDRVYVAGLSAGGAMAAWLGRQFPQRYAALGVSAGVPAGAARNLVEALAVMKTGGKAPPVPPGPPLPLIVFQGDHDRTVHPANGEHLMAAHAARYTARTEAWQAPGAHPCTRTRYLDVQGRTQGEIWRVQGGDHAWFGGRPAGSHTDPSGPDASAAMLDFFLQHQLVSSA